MDSIFLFLLILLLSISITKMWSDSDIFLPIRNFISDVKWLRKPFLCAKCMSFWFGFFVSLFVYDPFSVHFDMPIVFSQICFGLITHYITCFLIDHNSF